MFIISVVLIQHLTINLYTFYYSNLKSYMFRLYEKI